MAFKEKRMVGKLELETIVSIKNIKYSAKNASAAVTAEFHIMPDMDTYKQFQDEVVAKTLDYEKSLYRVEQITSRSLSPEKEAEFKDKLLTLFYEYFADGKEKV